MENSSARNARESLKSGSFGLNDLITQDFLMQIQEGEIESSLKSSDDSQRDSENFDPNDFRYYPKGSFLNVRA